MLLHLSPVTCTVDESFVNRTCCCLVYTTEGERRSWHLSCPTSKVVSTQICGGLRVRAEVVQSGAMFLYASASANESTRVNAARRETTSRNCTLHPAPTHLRTYAPTHLRTYTYAPKTIQMLQGVRRDNKAPRHQIYPSFLSEAV
jgi:hypothetical protein